MHRIICFLAFIAAAWAHSFLTVPMPFSKVETCRIGGNPNFVANCGGPCPNYDFRHDMRPEYPSATWRRGDTVTIHYSKNNHMGGFMRLTIVPLDEMYRKDVHEMMTFHIGCWSNEQMYTCNNKEYHRDCGYDLDNLAWKTDVVVPTVLPDGVYVLGWTWYGGGEDYGSFGDYYDCAYVQIKGGVDLTETYTAVFKPGPRYHDTCQSSVDKLGVCITEPCRPSPEPELKSGPTIPAEFKNGPPVLQRWWYEQAQSRPDNWVRVAEPNERFGITGFELFDTGNEMKMSVDLNEFVDMSGIQGITIIPIYYGHIDYVEWVVNGVPERNVDHHPFAISDSQSAHSASGHNFYDWTYPIYDKRVFVTAIAHSHGERVYYSQDFYFFKNW